uniref:Uncharacterized protein n=1 Tax=Strombidinopsis acuminata TaxID=141414 RepID=A0A7S3SQL5_9SPIT
MAAQGPLAGDFRQLPTEAWQALHRAFAPEAVDKGRLVDNGRLRALISEALSGGRDLAKFSLGQLRAELEERLGFATGGLDCRKETIAVLAKAQMLKLQQGQAAGVESDSEDDAAAGATPKKREKRERAGESAAAGGESGRKRRRGAVLPAEPMEVHLNGTKLQAAPRGFASGRAGFYACRTVTVTVDGQEREAQVLVQCTLLG